MCHNMHKRLVERCSHKLLAAVTNHSDDLNQGVIEGRNDILTCASLPAVCEGDFLLNARGGVIGVLQLREILLSTHTL